MDTFQAALAIGQTRTQLALGLVGPVSYPLLAVVVAWAGFPFCGYGLLSRRHLKSIVLAAGAELNVAVHRNPCCWLTFAQ